jgi:regulator of RNase E activity RraA
MTQLEPPNVDRFVELFRAVDASPKPAVVVFQEVGGHGDWAAHSGEVMATVFSRLGAVGLVSDCGVRDLPEVRALKFHYFARGAVCSHANFRIVRTGIPVQVEGLVVKPGDIVHGDENGLLLVPSGIEGTLAAKVDAVRAREGKLMSWVRSGAFNLDEMRDKMVE